MSRPISARYLPGTKHGRLTIRERIGGAVPMCRCDCDCGGTKTISFSSLTKGYGLHCGCLDKGGNPRVDEDGQRLTLAHLRALHWLVERGGDGCCTRKHGVLACGDVKGNARSWDHPFNVWAHVEARGLIERYPVTDPITKRHCGWRVRVTSKGYDVDQRLAALRASLEREAMYGTSDEQPEEGAMGEAHADAA